MTLRALSVLVLAPIETNTSPSARAWINALAGLSQAADLTSRPPAHSSRPARLNIHVSPFDPPGGVHLPWLQQLEGFPALSDSAVIALQSHAGRSTHLAALNCSALQCFALAGALAQFAGGASFATVAIEPSYSAVKLLAQPFGRQIAGRLMAMAEAAGIDLYMIAHGPGAVQLLSEAGFNLYTDIRPSPFFAPHDTPRPGDADAVSIDAGQLEDKGAAALIVDLVARHEQAPIALHIDAANAETARWNGFLEEIVLAGIPVRMTPPEDDRVRQKVEMAARSSRILRDAGAAPLQWEPAAGVRTRMAWRRETAPAVWIDQLVRKEHDRLASAVKHFHTAHKAVRIDTR